MHSWVPLGCNNWSHLPGRRLSPPPPQTAGQTISPPCLLFLLTQRSFSLSRSCGLRGRLLVCILAGAYRSALREQGPVASNLAFASASFHLLVSSRKQFISLPGALISVAVARGHVSVAWLWCPVELILASGPSGQSTTKSP